MGASPLAHAFLDRRMNLAWLLHRAAALDAGRPAIALGDTLLPDGWDRYAQCDWLRG
jgi:hypothetical protein